MKKKIFTVATAHLDTVWNWPFEKTIGVFLKKTLDLNFDAFEKYPDYRFNFEGAYRYRLIEEYYPKEFEQLKQYIASGRWYPCGSSYENGDVNAPSAEALFRNILYGNGYFAEKFGIRSKDIYLPDCFGFGWALPAIMRHANLKGFTTQKLTWGSSFGIPFDLGKWYGSNGQWVYGALNMGGYGSKLQDNMPKAHAKLAANEKYGLDCTTVFHGTGDTGGAPLEPSIKFLQEKINENETSKTEVISARADEVFDYLDTMDGEKLPTHKNELILRRHAAGGYTSRAIGKRWNKRNEILGSLAERAAVASEIFGIKEYPRERLTKNWLRVIAHQFHDDLPGTSLQKVYKRSWNDYMVSLNGFADEYNAAASGVIAKMDTTGEGYAVVVHNALAVEKTAVVTAVVPTDAPFVRVTNADGNEVASQVVENADGKTKILFNATVSSFGYEKYTVTAAKEAFVNRELSVSENSLENEKYLVKLNENGDICSILDKNIGKELLQKPICHEIFHYLGSKIYPAWEIPYTACNGNPLVENSKFVSAKIVENGGARVTLQVVQKYKKSIFTTLISLSTQGETVDVKCEVDWRSFRRLLKHRFCLTSPNKEATYDLGVGTIRRDNNSPSRYEVPAQNWADLTNEDGSYGVSVLSECKFGWDKPSDDTLRLTAIHTPIFNFTKRGSVQSKLEIGLNRYGFSIYSHAGAVGADTQQAAEKYLMPMPAFYTEAHEGVLGKTVSVGSLSDKGVLLKAVKKAEKGDGYVVRFYESDNKEHKNVRFTLKGLRSAREVFASEEDIGEATVMGGALCFDLAPYEVKSFMVFTDKESLAAPSQKRLDTASESVFTTNETRGERAVPGTDYSLPQELLSEDFVSGGVGFTVKGATVCDGQKIVLSDGTKKVHLLLTAIGADKEIGVLVGDKEEKIKVACATERIGVWDMIGLGETADIKTDTVAYEFTHTHGKDADNIAQLFYLFRYTLPIGDATEVTLPKDGSVLLFGATADEDDTTCLIGETLFDTATRRPFDYRDDLVEKVVEFIRKKFFTTKEC